MCDFLKIYMRKETIKCLFASGSSLSKKRKNDDAGKKKDNNKKRDSIKSTVEKMVLDRS